ncbi:glycosyltransferase [uncultured Friedmanniella sp.]|uniref:glycosyltransferase n=1 Tax=uncultured Friedmanniella sp. TaxID=335381 RepID=UPI0035CAC099
MRVCVLAFDTRGGVQPYVAVAEGLAHAGHDVTMVTTDDFADLVAGRGVRHAPSRVTPKPAPGRPLAWPRRADGTVTV